MVLKKLLLFRSKSDLIIDLKKILEYTIIGKNYIFFLFILLNTLGFIYNYRDLYTSKALFFIRRPISAPLNLPGIQGVGSSTGSSIGSIKSVEDARIFSTYIKSNKVKSILRKDHLKEVKACIGNSFSMKSTELIDVTFSELSGIINLQVSCINPKQSQLINRYLIKIVRNYSDKYNDTLIEKQTQESKISVEKAIKNFNPSLEKLTNIQMK